MECDDNTLNNVAMDTLLVDRAIYDFDGALIWDEDDDDQFPDIERPDFVGAPDFCITDPPPEQLPATRRVDYWFGGVNIACCNCGDVFGDVNCDLAVNPVDVVYMVNYVYKMQDARCFPDGWNCPIDLGDVNCDGNVNPVDVVYYVNYVYKNLIPFPCNGCE